YARASTLPEEVSSKLVDKYHFSTRELSALGWDDKCDRVVLPVIDVDGDLAGCVLRSEVGAVPKALSHTEPDAVGVFRNLASSYCIVVEDIYSALRASKYMNAVALLGTNLNDSRTETLKELKCKKYFLALDADAFDKTILYIKKYRNTLPLVPVQLTEDIKNMTPATLELLMNELLQ